MGNLSRIGTAILISSAVICAQAAGQGPRHDVTRISYGDVQPLWEMLRPHLPPALADAAPSDLERAWREWVAEHDARIRERVARGEQDTLVNLWLFGTSFTTWPPARPRDAAARGASVAEVTEARLDDLMAALASPGADGRLRSAVHVLRAAGIDPASAAGRARARIFLGDLRRRVFAEQAEYERLLQEASREKNPGAAVLLNASLYHERGLSGDTSVLSSFAIDSALAEIRASGGVPSEGIRRVAIVGPGLDVINKADGHDFYPEQTIQPFAVADSLIRHGLSRPGGLSVTTFDVSARVNDHLKAARERSRAGSGYLLHLALGEADRWTPGLVRYWEGAGARIGVSREPQPPPAGSRVNVRAVLVRPDVVQSIDPRDLNVVLERLELPEAERFDLVVATNVFTYYDIFEQALAVVNVARMLRPGGSLLSNQAVPAVPPMRAAVGHDTIVYSDRQFDHIFWYKRQ